jgi:hypothetical protein
MPGYHAGLVCLATGAQASAYTCGECQRKAVTASADGASAVLTTAANGRAGGRAGGASATR